jgi:enterochelin esterase-like enzyme
MSCGKLLQPVLGVTLGITLGVTLGITLVIVFVVGCAGPATVAPVSEAPAATATPVPAAATPTSTPAPPTSTPTATPAQAASRQERGESIHETFTSQALAGNLLGDPVKRGYFIYLPPGYADGKKRYPVVYVLHWFTGNEYAMTGMQDLYELLRQQGTVQDMILVFPDASNKLGGSQYLSSPTIGDYETYIARELVAHIDANYRTIPQRDSRGITGCSMGGDGAMHLALTFPDVYSVAVPMSASYDFANHPAIPVAAANFTYEPQDIADYRNLYMNSGTGPFISMAAGAAPNPDKPPFYLDMPFEVVDGVGRVVPEVLEKIAAVDEVHDLEEYLQQPLRLRHILLYHGTSDEMAPVELARSFDRLLTERGVDHEYIEIDAGHCFYDWLPVIQYLSDHLVAE